MPLLTRARLYKRPSKAERISNLIRCIISVLCNRVKALYVIAALADFVRRQESIKKEYNSNWIFLVIFIPLKTICNHPKPNMKQEKEYCNSYEYICKDVLW